MRGDTVLTMLELTTLIDFEVISPLFYFILENRLILGLAIIMTILYYHRLIDLRHFSPLFHLVLDFIHIVQLTKYVDMTISNDFGVF